MLSAALGAASGQLEHWALRLEAVLVLASRLKSPTNLNRAMSHPHPIRSAAAVDVEAPAQQDSAPAGVNVEGVNVPGWAGMSYDAQHDDIFSKPLNLKRITPKPDPAAQAEVRRRAAG